MSSLSGSLITLEHAKTILNSESEVRTKMLYKSNHADILNLLFYIDILI